MSNSLIKCHSSLLSNSMTSSDEVIKTRKISANPYRVLEAPGLCDDFYLNLVDWSSQNILGVALDNIVYVWNATTSTVQELCDVGEDDQVTSLSWQNKGDYLSIGTKSGEVQIWDVNTKNRVRTFYGHQARVSSLAWNNVQQ